MTTRTIPTRNGHTVGMSAHYPLWVSGGDIELSAILTCSPELQDLHNLVIASDGGEVSFHATEDQLRTLAETIVDYLATLDCDRRQCELAGTS